MSKITLLLFSLVLSLNGFAQSEKTIKVIAKYKVSFTKGGKQIITDNCELDIAQNRSYFYSLGHIAQMKVMMEKAARAESTGTPMSFEANEMRTDLYPYNTIKDYKRNLAIALERVGVQKLGYTVDTLNKTQWNITQEKAMINKLSCFKATSKKGTTIVSVWFCPSVPIQEGPFYYSGLPGLIVKAKSSIGWEAELTDLSFNKNNNKELSIEQYIPVSKAQLARARKNSDGSMASGQLPGGGSYTIEKL